MKTNYGFYKPPEYSLEFYSPRTTYNGDKLSLIKSRKPNFAKARRFPQYDTEAKRIGDRVGPGAYNNDYLTIGASRHTSTPVFCRFHHSSNKWFLPSTIDKVVLKNPH